MKNFLIRLGIIAAIVFGSSPVAFAIVVPNVSDGSSDSTQSYGKYWPLIQCNTEFEKVVDNGVGFTKFKNECDFPDIIATIGRITNFLIIMGVSVSAIIFAWAGILYLTAAGNPEQIKRAHGIFGKVLIGFILMLSAWLIVKFIQDTLVKPEYKNIEQFGQ